MFESVHSPVPKSEGPGHPVMVYPKLCDVLPIFQFVADLEFR